MSWNGDSKTLLSTIQSPFSFSFRSHSHSQILSFSSKTFHFHSPTSLRLSPFTSIMSPRATTSYSSGSCVVEDGGEREILVQHLLVKEDDKKLLLDLQKRLSAGEDLCDLAVDHSICPSKEEGGRLRWVRKGQMVPEFEEALFSAPLIKVVRCKTKFGWHFLQVLSEREESVFQDIQPDELHVKLQDPNFSKEAQLIDVREPEEVVITAFGRYRLPGGCSHRGSEKYTIFLEECLRGAGRPIGSYIHESKIW